MSGSRPCTYRATPAATAGSGSARCSSCPTSTSRASGPYYGDAWSDLDDFEASLQRVREEVAEWYVTFHHKGVIEGREQFVELVDAFTAVIDRRHVAMLEFLGEPHSIDDMVEHRFIYRPHVESAFVRSVERRSADLHVQRMLRRGEAVEVDSGRFRRV